MIKLWLFVFGRRQRNVERVRTNGVWGLFVICRGWVRLMTSVTRISHHLHLPVLTCSHDAAKSQRGLHQNRYGFNSYKSAKRFWPSKMSFDRAFAPTTPTTFHFDLQHYCFSNKKLTYCHNNYIFHIYVSIIFITKYNQ